jgi:hypothetical protein
MDFKKLSRFVIGFGAFLFGVGALWYLSNLPVDEIKRSGFLAGFPDPGMSDENLLRSMERGSATWTMVWGAIIVFAGFAVGASTKMPTALESADTSPEATSTTAINLSDALCPFCSKPLEQRTWQKYCPYCFQKLPPAPSLLAAARKRDIPAVRPRFFRIGK